MGFNSSFCLDTIYTDSYKALKIIKTTSLLKIEYEKSYFGNK